MSRKKKPAALFGAVDGPGFSSLRTPTGDLVARALSRIRRVSSDERASPGDNLGWLDRVYLVPTALARSWAQYHSLDVIAVDGDSKKKKIRLRGIVGLDGKQWTVTGPMMLGDVPELDLEHVAITELVPAEEMTNDDGSHGIVGRLFTFSERFAPEVLEGLGRNFRGIGPVFAKAGNEELALGFNARVIPVEGLELGQWFALDVPRLEAAA